MRATAGSWSSILTFGSTSSARRVLALAGLGLLTGIAEAAVVLLIVALAASAGSDLPFAQTLPDSTWATAGAAAAVLLVLAGAHYGSARLAARAAASTQRSVQRALVDAFLNAPWSKQAESRFGELQELVGPKTTLLALGAQQAAQMAASVLNLVVLTVAAALISVPTAVGLLVAVVLVVAVARLFRRRLGRVAQKATHANTDLALEVTESASLAREVRVYGVVGPVGQRLGASVDAAAELLEAVRHAVGATAPLTRDAFAALLVLAVALVVEWYEPSLVVLGASVALLLRALSHAQILVGGLQVLTERQASLEAVRERLESWQPAATSGTRPCPVVTRIQIRDVTYMYPGQTDQALSDVTLEIVAGEQVGIVGPTGAGKSTLASVLLGLIEPSVGDVVVNDLPLREIDPLAWSRRTAWVGQAPRLMSGTVADNIRFFRDHVDSNATRDAALQAGLEPELVSWHDGLEHPVGPAGAHLSGGQRQRVALARALAGKPELLVLDEPTSAQDPHAEAAIRNALSALRGESVVVVIAHRLSTIRECSRIAALDNGRLVALGPPTEVAAANEWFRDAIAHSKPGF